MKLSLPFLDCHHLISPRLARSLVSMTSESVFEPRHPLEGFELSSIPLQQPESGQQTPASSAPLTAHASPDALQRAIHDNITVQELAPIDGGIRAWTFCGCSFVLEMFIWGFCFR